MRVLFDSSAFAKRYVEEEGSIQVERILQKASVLGLCVILPTEIISALNRKTREQLISLKDYRNVKRQLIRDIRDGTVIQITPGVVSRSIKLLETSNLRALDSLHVACALEWGADFFVTSDRRQFHAAETAGLQSEFIGKN